MGVTRQRQLGLARGRPLRNGGIAAVGCSHCRSAHDGVSRPWRYAGFCEMAWSDSAPGSLLLRRRSKAALAIHVQPAGRAVFARTCSFRSRRPLRRSRNSSRAMASCRPASNGSRARAFRRFRRRLRKNLRSDSYEVLPGLGAVAGAGIGPDAGTEQFHRSLVLFRWIRSNLSPISSKRPASTAAMRGGSATGKRSGAYWLCRAS